MTATTPSVEATAVLDTLREHLQVDGFDLVLDLARSHGSVLVDARDGHEWTDLFTFFASSPLGMNHPGLAEDERFRAELLAAALNKTSNSDVYSVEMARFVATFARVLGDPALPHLFFIDGGGLAVENALKVAFDWKSRWNEAHGIDPELGTRVLHLRHAFHGRTGYTMSLTNTEPVKVARYPKLDWPRITSPYTGHEADGTPRDVEALEARALKEARAAFAAHPHDVACFVAEPIQGEGGDHHLRPEFLQAMQALCREHDALFVMDEVQTGAGLTGTAWAYQQLGVAPDVVAFGKKTQVCGIMAGGRVDEVPDNVFHVSSRLNSTWGGNLADMVRARRILEVYEDEGLIERAAVEGAYLLGRLEELAARFPGVVSDPRGRGLMCALSLPDAGLRDRVLAGLRDEGVLMLGCGERSVRFRPALTVERETLDVGVDALARVIGRLVG
ncbi:L-lysine 6-transaminase [Puerhibacterium puerhi]|uniref:L-lysine 6-transaminase n=1 Tax=Puerhibacterium puerhi TaxID=2692623 RepID=UPI001F28D45C|nr:L-lysine 6-transaminase [Puerhibacterium puerhi]